MDKKVSTAKKTKAAKSVNTSTGSVSAKKEAAHHQFNGVVVSAIENKTIHVLVKSIKLHPKYQKQYITSKKYAVHDEKNDAKVGDEVLFEECRPLSKTKKWRLLSVLKKEKKG